MPSSFRPLGVAVIVSLCCWSMLNAGNAAAEISARDEAARQRQAMADQAADSEAETFEEVQPQYLAFTAGFDPGVYDILDDPDSRDRDHTLYTSAAEDQLPADGELMPGLYASSFAATDCGYELHRVDRRRTSERLIGSDDLADGRLLVTINEVEPDRFISTDGCREWVEWSPLVEPLTRADNGDYWIGDLAHGTWSVPAGCFWEEVVGFRGSNVFDVIDSGWGPGRVEIDAESMGFRVRHCDQPLALRAQS